MAAAAQEVIKSIPGLLEKKDAAALVGLRDHEDKKVRKAVRKALHTLKSKGVEIPENSKAWAPADLKSMRGDLTPTATVDTASAPGAMRFVLSDPDTEEGARLYVGALGPDDRILEFNAYMQTDGQRSRLVKDWERRVADRKIDPDWLRGRIRWAREKTIEAGYSVPAALNQNLSQLGDMPAERPAFPLGDALNDQDAFNPENVDEVLTDLRVHLWPPMVSLDSTLQKAAEIHGDKPQPSEESERTKLLKEASSGNEDVRKGLQGALANALEDSAVFLWFDGNPARARDAADMAKQLRESDAPEDLDWVARLLGYQVASLLRAVGGPEAVQQAIGGGAPESA